MQQKLNYGFGKCYVFDFGIFSTKNQHTALCFHVVVVVVFIFHPKLCLFFFFVHETKCSARGYSAFFTVQGNLVMG